MPINNTNRYLQSLLMVACLLIAYSCSSDQDKVDSYFGFDIPKETLDRYLLDQMDSLNIPGMAIAFINDGKVVHHRTLGYANLQEQLAVTETTIFEAASLSKPVFAFFVMKYVEEGKLDLDTPLYTYLPYPDIAYDERYKKITARMVLSHRTGFPNWREDTPDDRLIIQFEPGTDYFYSGEGYQYLAKVLNEIEGLDWKGLEAEFQAKVAVPLGMEHSVFIQDDYSKRHKAEPYDEEGKWVGPGRNPDSLRQYQFWAPASLHSEPLDFSKWMIGLMEGKVLTEESYQELYRPHSFVDEFNGIKVDYTLGFFKPQLPLTNLYMHGGNNFGFTSSFALDPDKKWGFVLFTNSEYGEDLGNELTLYMLTGPDMNKVYLVLGLIVISVILIFILLIRWLLRQRKKIRASAK